jgi:hypothetical protein
LFPSTAPDLTDVTRADLDGAAIFLHDLIWARFPSARAAAVGEAAIDEECPISETSLIEDPDHA